MVDDDLKRLLEGHFAETRRHFDVTVERLENRFQTELDRRLRSLEERVERIEETTH